MLFLLLVRRLIALLTTLSLLVFLISAHTDIHQT